MTRDKSGDELQVTQMKAPTSDARFYIPIDEVARKLGVSRRWLENQCRDGVIEHVHLARKRKFTPEQVAKVLLTHTVHAEPQARDVSSRARTSRRIGLQSRP